MKISRNLIAVTRVLLIVLAACVAAHAQTRETLQDEAIERSKGNAEVATRQLRNADPLVRQRAAEELARLAAVDSRKLVEGYRLQEKNDRVRLALDWALYRMGKQDALFPVVRALGTNRYTQAQSYLDALESPAPLYLFLDRVNAATQIRLLESLARAGDADTLERIRPYAASDNPKVADAARFATREITRRLSLQH